MVRKRKQGDANVYKKIGKRRRREADWKPGSSVDQEVIWARKIKTRTAVLQNGIRQHGWHL